MFDKKMFISKFLFSPKKAGLVGVEREQFVCDSSGCEILPLSSAYLQQLAPINAAGGPFGFGYELSACQLESRAGPCPIDDLASTLCRCEETLVRADASLGLSRRNIEVAPSTIPLQIFNDPTGRYQEITKNMPEGVLSAACRVAGTHVHVGMPDIDTALLVYNRVIRHSKDLVKLGDGSCGERMSLYKVMAPRMEPENINSIDQFYAQAVEHGFADNPRSCWTLIRISIHGTIEFRMFGATDSIPKITRWAEVCISLCKY